MLSQGLCLGRKEHLKWNCWERRLGNFKCFEMFSDVMGKPILKYHSKEKKKVSINIC